MARTLCFLILSAWLSTASLAGPNAGGTLILHDAGRVLVNTDTNICQDGISPATCGEGDTEVDYDTSGSWAAVLRVYAAFPEASSPQLMGVEWGIDYDAGKIGFLGYSKCGADFELCDYDWPAPGRGCTVSWNSPQTGHLVPLYGFLAQAFSRPATITLTAHPSYGGYFGDASIPALLDSIAGYGTLGFDTPGQLACPDQASSGVPSPDPAPRGVCCGPDGACGLSTPQECVPPSVWQPERLSCAPVPCPPSAATDRRSWGRIKEGYR